MINVSIHNGFPFPFPLAPVRVMINFQFIHDKIKEFSVSDSQILRVWSRFIKKYQRNFIEDTIT